MPVGKSQYQPLRWRYSAAPSPRGCWYDPGHSSGELKGNTLTANLHANILNTLRTNKCIRCPDFRVESTQTLYCWMVNIVPAHNI